MASWDSKRPNVVLMISDDQGAWALGAAGNKEIHTPNLDALAQSGTRFTNFFCTSPVCSPARATLYTGQPPSKHGVHDWIRSGHTGPDGVDYLWNQPLITDVFSEHGYRCGLSGKWHLGANDRPRKGFAHWFSHQFGAGPYYNAPMIRQGRLATEANYITDVIGEDARGFINEEAGNEIPFWLNVNFTAPHSPWKDNHPSEITRLYSDCTFSNCPREPDHPWTRYSDGGWPIGREADLRASLVGYHSAITGMDYQVGKILETLESNDLTDSTVIVFLSDNGFSCGHHGVWGKGNGTYPFNMYDDTIRVPAVIKEPGNIPCQTIDQLVSGYDLAPSLLHLAGLPEDALGSGPGRSFVDLIRGHETSEEHVIVYDEYGSTRMLRNLEWKYVSRRGAEPDELYNLFEDPDERENLVRHPRQADTVRHLASEMDSWFEQYTDAARDSSNVNVTGFGQNSPLT